MTDYREFLERYYDEEIRNLVNSSCKILIIDFRDLDTYDSEAAERLLDNPDHEGQKLANALHEYTLPVDFDFEQLKISIKNLPDQEKIPIHRIGSEQVSKLIAVEGRISKIGRVKSKIIVGVFRCRRCEHHSEVQQPDNGAFAEPYECDNDVCGRKGPFELIIEESVLVDEQKLELQDLYENLMPGHPLRDILVFIRGQDLIETVPPIGAQVIITGIVRFVKKRDSSSLDTIIEVNHIQVKEPEIDISISDADKKELKQLAGSSDIFNKLIQSTAPTILGYPEIKLALLAAAVSGPNYTEPHFRRGYTHIIICGDPGTAKTLLVLWLRSVVPRSQYAAGRGASAAGLTVAVVKDELSGGYTAQAGALVLADMGLMVLDEAEKLATEDLQHLNTALELSIIRLDKAGLHQDFNCRCPIIALCNPKDIRFDNQEPLNEQIKIPGDTLSRFDLVFKILDQPEPEKDKRLVEHQNGLWREVGSKKRAEEPVIPIEMMRKYIAYAKTFEPTIPKEVSDVITAYYLDLRRKGQDRLAVTLRETDGLNRLTRSLAKLRLSNECSIEDIERAKAIHKASLEAITDPTTGLKDIDILYGGGKTQRDRRKTVKEIMRELQSNNGNTAYFNDIVSCAKVKGIPQETTEDILRRLKTDGEIIEVTNNFYRVIP